MSDTFYEGSVAGVSESGGVVGGQQFEGLKKAFSFR